MPNDAKFGLVVGVALVIAVAVVFFRKDASGRLAVVETPASQPAVPSTAPVTPPRNSRPAPPAQQVSLQRAVSPREHVIRPGDTLFSIAQEHYGDGERFYDIYQANRDVLKRPDILSAGVTLKIP